MYGNRERFTASSHILINEIRGIKPMKKRLVVEKYKVTWKL